MLKNLPKKAVQVLVRGRVEPAHGSPYTGEYAIVKIPGQDKLSILYGSKVGVNDGVRYVVGDKLSMNKVPVFGEAFFAQRESYDDATDPRLEKTAFKNMATPVRDVALPILKREQRRADHLNSIPITGAVLGEGKVSAGKQVDLTGDFKLVSNPRTSEHEAAFESKGDVFEMSLPRDSNTEFFFDNSNHQPLYDSERHYRLSHIWLIAERNRFEQTNPEVDYSKEYPVHAAALARLDELAFNK